jgi:hypothetical protein
MAVVFPARVVENGEQPDDLFDRTALAGYEQSIAFNLTPVRGAVDRIAVALKIARDVFPDAGPL